MFANNAFFFFISWSKGGTYVNGGRLGCVDGGIGLKTNARVIIKGTNAHAGEHFAGQDDSSSPDSFSSISDEKKPIAFVQTGN